jgi:hypothetical protein
MALFFQRQLNGLRHLQLPAAELIGRMRVGEDSARGKELGK